jgi:hypothetical protein
MENINTIESNTAITQPSDISKNIDYLKYIGGRKFSLSLVSIIFTTVLCWFGKIEPGIFSVVVVSAIGAYTAGNVIQNIKS